MKKRTETSSFGTSGRTNHDARKFYNSRMYKNLNNNKPIQIFENKISEEIENKILLKSSENMKELPNNSVHLMITSPPYNVSKEYDDDLTLNEYLNLLTKVFSETYRVLVNGGRACINVANLGRKPYIPLSDYISKIMIDLGFNMRGEVIWNKASSAGSSTAWGSWKSASNPILRDVHEYILIFSKGDYKREKKENSITRDEFMEYTKSIWNMNTVSAKKIKHPAPFPFELPYRLIQLYSFEKDVILDPFIGSGTTGLAALKTKRKYVGYEIKKEYKILADNYLNAEKMKLYLF